MMWLLSSIFSFLQRADLIHSSLKNWNYGCSPKQKVLFWSIEFIPFGKRYGIKVRSYEEHVGEHIGNLGNILGTHWELECNLVGTHWEARKNEKNSSPPSSSPHPPKLKRKKSKAPWMHAQAFPLDAWNFSSQKSSSPFSAWANTPCKEHFTH